MTTVADNVAIRPVARAHVSSEHNRLVGFAGVRYDCAVCCTVTMEAFEFTIEIKNSYRFATDGAGASVRQVLREVGVRAAVHAGAVATGRVAAQKALQPMSRCSAEDDDDDRNQSEKVYPGRQRHFHLLPERQIGFLQ